MTSVNDGDLGHLESQGWALLPAVFAFDQVGEIADGLEQAFAAAGEADDSVRQRGGAVYAARNVLDFSPMARTCWRTSTVLSLLAKVLGENCGLVRALYFDKPPDQTWALPWHKDLTIAIADGRQVPGYSRPRLKSGVFHTEPPWEVLEGMLTLRIHIDPADARNGGLAVISGSHKTGKQLNMTGLRSQLVICEAGDVLAMRPLLIHGSGRSAPACRAHRRVLHLEFAASQSLPENVHWHFFEPVFAAASQS